MIIQDGEKCTSYEKRVVYWGIQIVSDHGGTDDWKTDKVFTVGREYCNTEFDQYLVKSGIECRLTIPQQNGMAERFNRTLQDMARCLTLQSGLTEWTSFWTDAIVTACYIRNQCPASALGEEISFEKWTGESLSYDNLRSFGSKVFVLDKDPTKINCLIFGRNLCRYPRETKGFRVWIPSKHKIIVARDVRFLEEINDIVEDSLILDDLTEESTIDLNEKSIKSFLRGHLDLVQINSTVPVQPVVVPGTPYEPATQC